MCSQFWRTHMLSVKTVFVHPGKSTASFFNRLVAQNMFDPGQLAMKAILAACSEPTRQKPTHTAETETLTIQMVKESSPSGFVSGDLRFMLHYAVLNMFKSFSPFFKPSSIGMMWLAFSRWLQQTQIIKLQMWKDTNLDNLDRFDTLYMVYISVCWMHLGFRSYNRDLPRCRWQLVLRLLQPEFVDAARRPSWVCLGLTNLKIQALDMPKKRPRMALICFMMNHAKCRWSMWLKEIIFLFTLVHPWFQQNCFHLFDTKRFSWSGHTWLCAEFLSLGRRWLLVGQNMSKCSENRSTKQWESFCGYFGPSILV